MSEDIRDTGAMVYPEALLTVYSIRQYANLAEDAIKSYDLNGLMESSIRLCDASNKLLTLILNMDEGKSIDFRLKMSKHLRKQLIAFGPKEDSNE